MELPDFPTRTPVPTPTFTPAPTATRPQPLPGSVLPSPIIYQTGGQISAVAAAGNLAYVGVGPRLYILDVTDPANPQVVGVSGMLPGVIEDLVVGEGVVYAAAGTLGIYVMDVHNPTLPQPITTIPVVYERHQLYLYENLLLVIDQNRIQDVKDERLSQLIVVDVTDPASPVQQDVLALPDWSSGLAWYQSYLYVAIHSYYYGSEPGLLIINASALPKIEPITFLTVIDDPFTLVIHQEKLFLSTVRGVIAYDLADPLAPVEQTWYESGFPVNDKLSTLDEVIVASSNFCDVGECSSSLKVYPFDQPEAEKAMYGANLGYLTYDLAVEGDMIFAAVGTKLVILTISPTWTPYRLSTWDSTGIVELLSWSEQRLYTFNGTEDNFAVFETNNPAQPVSVERYDMNYTVRNFIVVEDFVYLSAYSYGLVTLHVDDFEQVTSSLTTPFGHLSIEEIVLANHLVFTLFNGHLLTIDVSKPDQPTLITPLDWQERETNGSWSVLAWDESYLYGGMTDHHLALYDISDPMQPREVGSINLGSRICQITPQDDHVYTVTGSCFSEAEAQLSQLHVVTTSDPTQPELSGSLTLNGVMLAVAAIGDYVYVANGDVLVVDISDPSQPVLITTITTPGYASDLLTADGLLYVADQAGGLLIIQPFE
jgi:hypothetical protein